MSLWRDDLRPSQATLAALGALALVAVGSLSRVIGDPVYLVWGFPALAIGAAFAFAFGRRSLALGFGLLVLATIATLPALFARDKTVALLPTTTGLRAVRQLMSSGFKAAPNAAPPVDAEPRFLILLWTAFLILGFLCAAWIVVRRPLGAVVSILGVVTFSGSVGDGDGRNVIAVAAVASTGAFFLAEGRQRIARWGGGRIPIPTWFGVPTLAAACAFALAAPFLIGDSPVVELRSALRPRLLIIKPLSDIKRQLKVDPPIEVMRVISGKPTYWRLTGLDSYDGREWVLNARPRAVRNGVLPPPNPPANGELLEQQYRLTSLLAPWLPAAYAAQSVDSTAPMDLDAHSQTLLLRGDTQSGLAYTVRSQLPHVAANFPGDLRVSKEPGAVELAQQARSIVSGVHTPLRMAERLEQHFRKFNYNEDVEGGHTVDRLQRFLRDRTGYCEQFAATMTLMLRGLGVDARVGVGFLPGSRAGGEFVVSTRDAHAWVEVNLPGAGWTTFDPTPGRGTAASAPSPDPDLQEPLPQTSSVPQVTPEPADGSQDLADQGRGLHVPAPVLWTALGMAIVASVPTSKRLRRRSRLGRTTDAAVVGAWAELVDRARDLGWSSRAAETLREFCTRVTGDDAAAVELSALVGAALYGREQIDATDIGAAWSSLDRTLTTLRGRTPTWRRLLSIVDVRTFIPSLPANFFVDRPLLSAAVSTVAAASISFVIGLATTDGVGTVGVVVAGAALGTLPALLQYFRVRRGHTPTGLPSSI